ncbi:MAG: penicillin-binding protein 2, partial [Shewanellaceae bacterium]|nr:penicillin-binding protein 2 [Shewanellaceae bacterium]
MRKVVIQNHSEEAALFKSRSAFLFVCIMMSFMILLANLYHLQVVLFSDYQMRSNENRTRMRAIAPNRGLIYDRNGVLIAENRPFFSLEMIPEKVTDIQATLAELAKLFNLSEAKQVSLLKEIKRHKSFRPFTILEQLDEAQVAKFSVVKYKFEGVHVYAGLKRHYPYGDYLTHVLGYVGRINVQDQQRLEKENLLETYAATHNIGKLGIEAYYEELLHGNPGRIQEEVNNHGRSIQVLQEKAPQSGLNLHLTIDLDLQKKAMDLLGGRRGAVVAIEPDSGEILAMVSSPSYDPNLFIHGINDASYKLLIESKDKPLINRSTQGTYAPASTIKAHLVLAGLNYQIITASSKVWDPGWWQVPGVSRKFRDWKKWGHGWIDLHNAVAKSCDVYFYDLAY